MERYSRNQLYISQDNQRKISNLPILIYGCGIGSNIAECALRMGFENITLVDGADVEESDLNRQNFTVSDLKQKKVQALSLRLLKINPDAKISIIDQNINTQNLSEVVVGHSIAVNCGDFSDEILFKFDSCCGEHSIPVIHPYNFGFGAMVTIIKPGGYQLSELSMECAPFELKIANYVSRFGHFWNRPLKWLDEAIDGFRSAPEVIPVPQLAIGSWLAASLVVEAMYKLVTGEPVDYFPKFYLSSMETSLQ